MANVIGDEHGITDKQWAKLTEEVEPLIPIIMKEIVGHKRHPNITPTRYGLLPANTELTDELIERAKKLKGRYDNLVVLGIGGSALGNIALQTALNPYMYNLDDNQRQGWPRLFVLDNVDPAQLSSFLKWLDDGLKRTLFNVISKAGRTAETVAQLLIIKEKLEDTQEPLADHIIVTTGFEINKEGKIDSTLYKIADELKLPMLEVPKDVGGRFSVLSAVGLFSAAMCGIEIDELLAGARYMHERVSCENFEENPAAINAAINYHYYNHGKKNSVIVPYAYALKDMADWYRQLWAESLGKKLDLNKREVWIGPTPVKALGATDQHSQVQLYREGPNDKLFTFLQVEHFDEDIKIGPAPDCAPELGFLAGKKMSELLNNEKKATEYALLESKRPNLTVIFDKVNAYTIGQFIYLYEVTTSLAGALFNINTYDQPAVELGKEATFALMGKNGEYKKNYTYEQFAQDIRAKTNVDVSFLV
ncbi:Glucose-6-phosphate isomerase [subsurface metagenome]